MGILDGIVEWIAEQVMNILDLITTSVLGALGCSMDTFQYVEDIIEEDTPTLVLFHGSNIAFDKSILTNHITVVILVVDFIAQFSNSRQMNGRTACTCVLILAANMCIGISSSNPRN